MIYRFKKTHRNRIVKVIEILSFPPIFLCEYYNDEIYEVTSPSFDYIETLRKNFKNHNWIEIEIDNGTKIE